jgi:transposase
VFLDETWTTTNMARRYGRADRSQRCIGAAPYGSWKTTTFIAGLRHNAVTAPMVVQGPMDGELFLAYVQTCLCPTLQPGDIVVADNLSSHKVAGVEEALAAVGASIHYLPPYSPDLNPIENFFAKLKAHLCAAALRTMEEVWSETGRLLNTITADECGNYFRNAGYVNN